MNPLRIFGAFVALTLSSLRPSSSAFRVVLGVAARFALHVAARRGTTRPMG